MSNMSLKSLGLLCFFVSVVICDETPKTDAEVSGADFLPQFQPFPPTVLTAPHDLTALQQTHILGNFHHRFHPTRLNPQFGVNAVSPLVLAPQTHIIPPLPTVVQDPTTLLQQPLIPPQPSPSHHEILRPPSPPQQDSFVSAQPLVNTLSSFKSFPTLKSQNSFSSANDQSIRNAFPSNAPHTIKFSISSTNYNPNQARQQVNPPPQQQQRQQQQQQQHQNKINHQVPQGRFVSPLQVQQSRPIFHQSTSVNFQQQQSFDASKTQQANFQNFNLKKPEVGINQQTLNFNGHSKPSFGPSPIPGSADFSSQYQINVQQSNTLPPTNNFDVRPTDSQLKFSQPNFDIRQNDLQHQTQFSQQQFVQPNFELSQQSNLNLVQPTPQSQFQFTPTELQQPKFSIQPSLQSNFEYRSTEPPRVNPTEIFTSRQQESVKVSPTIPQPVPTFFQNSQEQSQYTLSENLSTSKLPNEVSPSPSASPSPTTLGVRPTLPPRYRKAKPIVKEITINLNDKKISSNGEIPSQLYIKEDRQKEFLEIKEQEEKDQRKGKNDKSQEDVINEQIQKLLQSHNLEIIDKDNDSQSESQEIQLSQFSEQFKKKYNYSIQLLNGGSLLREVKPKKKILTTLPPLPELPEHIKSQYDIKLVNRDDLFKQFDLSGNHKIGNDSSNVFLANGQNLEIVKFSKDGIMNKIPVGTKADEPTTTTKPPNVLFEELTKSVIPPGADFELIKHSGDGKVEKVTDLNPAKKVTFVFLEEQPDGSVKVQGVKGNTNQGTEGHESVDSLIQKINDGSLKLPPSKQASLLTNEITRINPVSDKTFVTFPPATTTSQNPRSVQKFPSTVVPFYVGTTERNSASDVSYSSPYVVDLDSTYTPTPFYETTPEPPTTFQPTINYVRSSTRKTKSRSRVTFLPTVPSIDATFTPTFGSKRIKPTTHKPTSYKSFVPSSRKSHKSYYAKTTPKYDEPEYHDSEILSHKSTEYSGRRLRVPQDVVAEESNIDSVRPLNEILSENGLKEMAKFLDQSGLDTILNETGPYTVFIPTDKAFKTLEAQLGGPDKAEDKFRENPRLLSGLLLHHVVPGSFRLEDLQDEMTGVSLAGTQLRVNTYVPEEKQSDKVSEERIVTINGAKVSNEKKDITVPQGLAHAIDRVLFPLPVGDIVQTLRGDRERRFTKFLKSLESSGLTDMLTGTKTYTVFAPTDKAFSTLTDSELDKLLTRREAAKTIVLRHVVPGTLYSAGMNYFQVKDSMESGQKIVIKKELGKIKANSAQIVSANIPATNGVIHAVESLL